MKFLLISAVISFLMSSITFSQSIPPQKPYGETGLQKTKEVLTEVELPDWYWAGAHVYENVYWNYQQVNGELLNQYFVIPPVSGLNDPQQILTSKEREKIETLTKSHNIKYSIPLYINLLRQEQILSLDENQLKTRISKTFKGENAIVVFYHYGDAREVKGYLTLADQGFIEDWEVNELFIKSAQDAIVEIDNFTEIETFIREFSKRTFWLEQRLVPQNIPEQRVHPEEPKALEKHAIWTQGWQILKDFKIQLVIALLSMIACIGYYLWSRRWRKYVLPIGNPSVRLGAEYGANVSDSIDYSDANISLTDQYEKIKNKSL